MPAGWIRTSLAGLTRPRSVRAMRHAHAASACAVSLCQGRRLRVWVIFFCFPTERPACCSFTPLYLPCTTAISGTRRDARGSPAAGRCRAGCPAKRRGPRPPRQGPGRRSSAAEGPVGRARPPFSGPGSQNARARGRRRRGSVTARLPQ